MTITFLRLPQVIARTGLKHSSIYAFMQAGTFPKQIPLGERAVAWRSDEVQAWIDQKIEAGKKQRAAP